MIEIATKRQLEVIDITPLVERASEESGTENGICVVYTIHTTTGITINEAESGLIEDITNLLASLIPRGRGYHHDRIDDNAASHLQAMLLGNSVVIPVENKRLILGTWQRILFLELDGPRKRKISVKTIPG